jgi:hypothetical protein
MAEKPSKKPGTQAADDVPRERSNFRRFIASNANYFGNLEKSPLKVVTKIVGNTTYEELTCIGYNPALSLLEATVQIKRPSGYLGGLCTAGSTEYVRFYVDYGGGWVDAGLASFNVHDIPNGVDCAKDADKPLLYVVTLALNPNRRFCIVPNLPNVRAILSWNLPPLGGTAGWLPVWGNVLDRHIQIKPRQLIFGDVVDLVSKDALQKLPPLSEEVKPIPIPLPDPPPFTLAQLAQLYSSKPTGQLQAAAVEPHRFGLAHAQALIDVSDQNQITAASAEWKAAGFDLADVLGLLDKTNADVSYEQLDCLGLEYNLDRLVATLRIKRPAGYSGGLCTAGSQEYVAFWADWNNTCQWTYLGTVPVNVHDIPTIPPDGLVYSAILPVDLTGIKRPCGGPDGGPKIARIRAVLSWNTAPSTTDPDALTHWGNRLDTHVQLRPGPIVAGVSPVMSIIGGIGVADIHVFGNGLTKPAATFALGGSPADPWMLNRECPFGGLVIVQGPPVLFHKYRLWAREFNNAATETIVKNPIHVVNWLGVGSNVTPDPITGYVTYMSTLDNMDQVLAHWVPPGDQLWQIRVEMATLGEIVVGSTAWHTIQSDNTGPRRRPAVAPFEPPPVTCEIHIDSGGDCKDFNANTTITGRFTARDDYFGAFSLMTLPTSISPNAPTTATPSTSQTATFAANGDGWSLNTTGMKPCGYVVLLQVWDRAIVGSQPGSHNYNFFDVGFCLRG